MAEGLVLKENRSLVRRELIYYLKVTNGQTGQELGRLGDIHTGGMLLFSPEPLPLQAVYNVFLELPKIMAEEEGYPKVPIKAKAIWSLPGPSISNHYENGFQFLKLSRQAKRVIHRLTEIFAMPGS